MKNYCKLMNGKIKEPQLLKETTDSADGAEAMISCKCTISITADGPITNLWNRGITRMKLLLRYARIAMKRHIKRKQKFIIDHMTTEEFSKLDNRFSEYNWHQAKINEQVTNFIDELLSILINAGHLEIEVEPDLYWPHVWNDNDCYLISVEKVKIDPDKTVYLCDAGFDYEFACSTLTDLELCEILLNEIARIK